RRPTKEAGRLRTSRSGSGWRPPAALSMRSTTSRLRGRSLEGLALAGARNRPFVRGEGAPLALLETSDRGLGASPLGVGTALGGTTRAGRPCAAGGGHAAPRRPGGRASLGTRGGFPSRLTSPRGATAEVHGDPAHRARPLLERLADRNSSGRFL